MKKATSQLPSCTWCSTKTRHPHMDARTPSARICSHYTRMPSKIFYNKLNEVGRNGILGLRKRENTWQVLGTSEHECAQVCTSFQEPKQAVHEQLLRIPRSRQALDPSADCSCRKATSQPTTIHLSRPPQRDRSANPHEHRNVSHKCRNGGGLRATRVAG